MDTPTTETKPRQRPAGDTITLSPVDRKTLLLAAESYRDSLHRQQKRYKARQPELFDVYSRLENDLDKALRAIG